MSKIKLQPLGDKIIVKPLEEKEVTKEELFSLKHLKKNRRKAR